MSFRNDVLSHKAWSPAKQAILVRAQEVDPRGDTYYVDTIDGAAGNDGLSWERALLTMDGAFDKLKSGDTIRFRGDIEEQLVTPVQIFDVTVIGDSNRPRHSDTAPESLGRTAGASWRPPSSPTAETPLVEVLQQGWTFVNILFDAPSDAAAVQLTSDAGVGDDERDASHASFYGCKFVGGESGIQGDGGQAHVLIYDCEFNSLTTGVTCSSTSVRVNQYWDVRNTRFVNNTNHFTASLNYSTLIGNVFLKHTTDAIDLTFNAGQGEYNYVGGNFLGGTYSNAGGYTAGANDEWGGNFNSIAGGVTAADPS